MQPSYNQPNGGPIPDDLVSAVLRGALGSEADPPAYTVIHHDQYSNDLAGVTTADGRRMIIKRGRYQWSKSAFQISRTAAELFRAEGIVTPASFDIPEVDEYTLDAYWRIELPTLIEVWPRLNRSERKKAMLSLGQLIGRAHDVSLRGYGDFCDREAKPLPLSLSLTEDLAGRLMPAIRAEWPDGEEFVDALLGMIPEVVRRAPEGGVLVHGDLHIGNVLCEERADGPRCVGLLDLECAQAAPREYDLARLAVLHTELFEMPLEGDWLPWVLAGYREPIDAVLFHFYKLYHLVQLGFYSALLGHEEHADRVSSAARSEAGSLSPSWGESVPVARAGAATA